MSRANSSAAACALALALTLGACASTASTEAKAQEQEMADAIAAATAPATAEQIAAANRADPLTKANFWAKEYQKDPTNLENAITFTKALRKINSHQRAIEVASKTSMVHPGSADLMLELGRAYVSKGDLNNGTQAFARVAAIAPERADGWASLGTGLDQMGRHMDAQMAYMKALAIEPNRTSTLTNYGLSLALVGELTEAEAQLQKAAAQPDADLRVRENLALVQGLSGNYEGMAATSGAHAPSGIVKNNVEALRAMIQPTRTWESLAQTAEIGAVPKPNSPVPRLPDNTETPETAETKAVEAESIGLVGAAPEAEPAAATEAKPASGLRLRRK